MAVSSKAGTTAIFDLKSAALSVLALRLKTADLHTLTEALQQQFGATPGLFEHEPLCLDLGLLPAETAAPDFVALLQVLRGHGFNPVAVQGAASPEVLALALAAGLAEATLAQGPKASTRPAPAAAPAAAEAATPPPDAAAGDSADADAGADEWPDTVPPDLFAAADAAEAAVAAEAAAGAQAALPLVPPPPEASGEAAALAAPWPAEAPPPAQAIPTLVIDKPLRSGQRVYARGSDLVVLAVVSHGAEVIADGSIHVYAPLRGRALAGAKGDATARIFAVRMEAQLVSIAGVWRTTEAGLPADVAAQPAQVRLDGDRLLFEPLKF
jgi:septum site-determining protein MinC